MTRATKMLLAMTAVVSMAAPRVMADAITSQFDNPMLRGDIIPTSDWTTAALITVGDELGDGVDFNLQQFGYRVPGILDGLAAFQGDERTVWILANHELAQNVGYAYKLSNGTELVGARASYFNVDNTTFLCRFAGPLYLFAFDRRGVAVSHPKQINELAESTPGINTSIPAYQRESADFWGFDRFCSSYGIVAGDFNYASYLYLTGEETTDGYSTIKLGLNSFVGGGAPFGYGGQLTVTDPISQTLYVVPGAGRAAFENVAPVYIDVPSPTANQLDKVALLIGDDRQAAPLYLYIGEKGRSFTGQTPRPFLQNNGLGYGRLFAWVADNGDRDPEAFNGTNEERTGKFKRITHFNSIFVDNAQGGFTGWDSAGFASQWQQDFQAELVNAFRFSRPEDLATDPNDPTRAAMASTGRGGVFPSDNWGAMYLIDIDDAAFAAALDQPSVDTINDIPASIRILYDGDDAGGGFYVLPGLGTPDFGIRSPDNIEWSAKDNKIYICEDRSTEPSSLFGADSGEEASVWQLNAFPEGTEPPTISRIAKIARSAIPNVQFDRDPGDLGDWESSGVLDVSDLFPAARDLQEPLLLVDVQAHSLVAAARIFTNEFTQVELVEANSLARGAPPYNDGIPDADPSDDLLVTVTVGPDTFTHGDINPNTNQPIVDSEVFAAQRQDLVEGGQLIYLWNPNPIPQQ